MHELSIALSIVEIAQEQGDQQGGRIDAVHLRLGSLAGVTRDALLFCYDVACQDTPLAGSRLVIQDVVGTDLQVSALEIEE
jgi:hydrogenase nickel incorporation protein HypA/HybF